MSSNKTSPKPVSKRGSRSARGLRRLHDIEHVQVEQPFSLYKPRGTTEEDRKAGDGCYISATVRNRKYYGMLVDQAALVDASRLWFEEEAGSLDINKRMKMLRQKMDEEEATADNGDKKRPASTEAAENEAKRAKTEESVATNETVPDQPGSSSVTAAKTSEAVPDKAESSIVGGGDKVAAAPVGIQRQVQKFRYVDPENQQNPADLGIRYLLATFADIEAASEEDSKKAKLIEEACNSGGDFVGKCYYQYEVLPNALQTPIKLRDSDKQMRTSMGFDKFLSSTQLPKWFPLATFGGQKEALSILGVKKDNKGQLVLDPEADSTAAIQGTHVPMEPRSRFRIGIIGGGIAGLACALEVLRLGEKELVDVEVVLLEGRSRLGGRLWTDIETFKRGDGETPFPVDLGASWIHGIEHNPLANLAQEANLTFVTSSEEVKMLRGGRREVEYDVDKSMGKLFDDLLDLAADDCWGTDETTQKDNRNQMAVRWYSSILKGDSDPSHVKKAESGSVLKDELGLEMTDAPAHRYSSDISIDCAIGNAIKRHKIKEFAKLTKDEHLMLQWNMKNVEYALGANISDLSMKFWDSDERHAFEGDHVLLKEGYSAVIGHLIRKLESYGDRFQQKLDFPVGKIEYARRTTSQKYQDRSLKNRKLVELSDTCSISSQDGNQDVKCDFLVCAVPLGVLKDSIDAADEGVEVPDRLSFEPPLPVSKRDAISTVGFGLLDKLYIQFSTPFWREPLGLTSEKYLFGNSSGVHPHFYMFSDIGLTLGTQDDAPAILMSLVSGKEAVLCEQLSKEEMVQQALETLKEILSPLDIPYPIAVKRTMWGKDRFSRGCYAFLPPGATDQDFQMLQSPVNGNGDALLLEGTETMRMFFAGEHTTALYPSMAHGAMLSGIRAAKEIVAAMSFSFRNDKHGDRMIPVAIFRRENPGTKLQCGLCQEVGSRVREGSLLALKRGSRQVLVHNNCAEYSPEVEVYEGQWKNVIKAVNRGRALNCVLCKRPGATIGCTHSNCFRCYHFSCSEDTGWRFERDGKVYFCDLHRNHAKAEEADKVSLKFYRSKTPYAVVRCFLCSGTEEDSKAGKLLCFQRKNRRVLVHEMCARHTTIVDVKEDSESRTGIEFKNVFEAIEKATECSRCGRHGATIGCASCDLCYHFGCAIETGWKSDKKKRSLFRCEKHRVSGSGDATKSEGGAMFQHALFSMGGGGPASTQASMPSNSDVGGRYIEKSDSREEIIISDDSSDSEQSWLSNDGKFSLKQRDFELAVPSEASLNADKDDDLPPFETKRVRVERDTVQDPWMISLVAIKEDDAEKPLLRVESVAKPHHNDDDSTAGHFSSLEPGDVMKTINGMQVGRDQLSTLKKVLHLLEKQVLLLMDVIRVKNADEEETQKDEAKKKSVAGDEEMSRPSNNDDIKPHYDGVGVDEVDEKEAPSSKSEEHLADEVANRIDEEAKSEKDSNASGKEEPIETDGMQGDAQPSIEQS